MFVSSTGNIAVTHEAKAATSDPFIHFVLAVFMAEIVKLLTCIGLVLLEEGTFLRFKASVHNAIIKNKTDTVS